MNAVIPTFSRRRPELAIDFGTANLRVIRRDEGVVLDEPSLCCFANMDSTPTLFAAGAAAHAMIDRTPASLKVQRPLRRGVLQDMDAASQLLRYAVTKACGRRTVRARHAIIGVPADATLAERNALTTAAQDAGLGNIQLVSEPFAAAIGAGLPIDTPHGTLIVECGAGTTEVAILSLGGTCQTRSIRIGGATLDKAISDHLHFRHKFLVGDLTAERIKQDYAASTATSPSGQSFEVRGRSLSTGMPATLALSRGEIDKVMEKHAQQIADVIRQLLNETPPELSQDIYEQGIFLTGGSASIPMLQSMIAKETGLSVTVAQDPARCVSNGLHHMLRS